MNNHLATAIILTFILTSATFADEPWGPVENGVKTRLTCITKEPAIGKPILLKLELMNVSDSTVYYSEMQAGVNDSIKIADKDENRMPYIYGSYQTCIGRYPLGPQQTAILFDDVEADKQYFIGKPGPYFMQYRGGQFFDQIIDLPPSNIIRVNVKEGKPSLKTEILGKILPVCPKEWWLDCRTKTLPQNPDSEMITIYIQTYLPNRYGLKDSVIGVKLLVMSEKKEEGFQDELNSKTSWSRYRFENYLDKTFFCYLYLNFKNEGEVKKLWPDAEQQITKALGLTE